MSTLIKNVEDFDLTIQDAGSTGLEMFGNFPGYMFITPDKDTIKRAMQDEFNKTPLNKLNSQLGMDILKKYVKPEYHCQIVDSIFVPAKSTIWSGYNIQVYRRYTDKIDVAWCFKLFVKDEYRQVLFDTTTETITEELDKVGWKVTKLGANRIGYKHK